MHLMCHVVGVTHVSLLSGAAFISLKRCVGCTLAHTPDIVTVSSCSGSGEKPPCMMRVCVGFLCIPHYMSKLSQRFRAAVLSLLN